MCYDLPRSRCVEQLLLHQLRLCLSQKAVYAFCLLQFYYVCLFAKSANCMLFKSKRVKMCPLSLVNIIHVHVDSLRPTYTLYNFCLQLLHVILACNCRKLLKSEYHASDPLRAWQNKIQKATTFFVLNQTVVASCRVTVTYTVQFEL